MVHPLAGLFPGCGGGGAEKQTLTDALQLSAMKYLRIQQRVHHALRVPYMSMVEWQSLLGLLNSVEDQVALGRLHLRQLLLYFNHQLAPWMSPDHPFPVPCEPHSCLLWWMHRSNVMEGVPFNPDNRLVTCSRTVHPPIGVLTWTCCRSLALGNWPSSARTSISWNF